MYLGLDASTQSLTALIICPTAGKVVAEANVHFGTELPNFKSPSGFLENEDAKIVHANPLMWVAALDLIFNKLQAQGAPLAKIKAISGAGQQHATVYLNDSFSSVIGSLSSESDLASQIEPTLSRATSPIWMDSSTSTECSEIASSAGGDQEVCKISGSITTPRFSGPQIRKFSKSEPRAYQETTKIHLTSSFLSSILAGKNASLDPGDASGMNLMDLTTLQWSPKLIEATASELSNKLPHIAPTGSLIGNISPYFVNCYGFSADCHCLTWTGDNPASLVGMGASNSGQMVISLGTSDTLFAAMPHSITDPNGYGHVFGNPKGGFMSLICFANGSLAREHLKSQLSIEWDTFGKLANSTATADDSRVCLPFLVPEITPKLESNKVHTNDWNFESASTETKVRTLLEGQFFNMLHHMKWMKTQPSVIYVTGGASQNKAILQLIANIFQCETARLTTSSSVALGAAITAADNDDISFDQLSEDFCNNFSEHYSPNVSTTHYQQRMEKFIELVDKIIGTETGSI